MAMLSLSSPLSLYAIPMMWLISYYPAMAKIRIMKKARAFDSVQPRSNIPKLSENEDIPPELVAKVQRIEGAHLNGLENLPFFGLAVLAGNFAGIDNCTLNIAAGLYLGLRVVYNCIYINQTNKRQAALRSLTWGMSLASPFYLLIKSASIIGQTSAKVFVAAGDLQHVL